MRSENLKWNKVEKIFLVYVPQKPIIPKNPSQISNPTPKLPERVIQNVR